MINLIPKEEKKKMVKSFYYRLVIVFLFMLGICIFISCILLIPSYVVSSSKYNSAQTKLENQKNEPIPNFDPNTILVIKDLKNKLGLIETNENNQFDISEKVINAIIAQKTSKIKILAISYNKEPLTTKVSLTGVAPSREVLLSFQRALEDDPNLKNVDLPVSNFIKGFDIQFSMTLTPA